MPHPERGYGEAWIAIVCYLFTGVQKRTLFQVA